MMNLGRQAATVKALETVKAAGAVMGTKHDQPSLRPPESRWPTAARRGPTLGEANPGLGAEVALQGGGEELDELVLAGGGDRLDGQDIAEDHHADHLPGRGVDP